MLDVLEQYEYATWHSIDSYEDVLGCAFVCETRNDAVLLCSRLAEIGITWQQGESLAEYTFWYYDGQIYYISPKGRATYGAASCGSEAFQDKMKFGYQLVVYDPSCQCTDEVFEISDFDFDLLL